MTRSALLVAALGAAWLLSPSAAQADAATGFSLGGGVGRYNIRINNATAFKNTVSNYSKNDTAYQFFAKWRFAPFFALEGQYMNLGTSRSFIAPGTQYTTKIYGWAPWLVGTLPLGPVSSGVVGPFELFVKAGEFFYQYHDDLSTPAGDFFSSSKTYHHFVYGGGIGLVFVQRLDVRLEYDELKIQNTSTSNALWLTAAFNF
jgi:hypothetical protein